MTKFKDEDGNEVEAFTQEELDAKVKEATDTATGDKEKIEAEKATLQKTIDENKEKIIGLESKGQSVDDLRRINEGLETQLKGKDEEHAKKVEELQSKIPDPRAEKLKAAAKGDEALEGKLKARMDEYKDKPADDEAYDKRLNEVAFLESQESVPEALGTEAISSAGGDGTIVKDSTGATASPELIKMAKNFGMTPEEYTKYEAKAKADGLVTDK